MAKPIKGKDGKFQGSIGDGKNRVPTPAPHRASNVDSASFPTDGPAYDEQFRLMKATTESHSRTEDGVIWTQSHAEARGDGWTVLDERTTGTYTGLKGEGYSGVQPNMAVEVNRTQYIRPDGSVARERYSCAVGGAWLAVNDPELDLRLDGSTRPAPEKRVVVTSFVTAGTSFRIFRHPNPEGSGFSWSADAHFLKDGGDVADIWTGPNTPSERDLIEAVHRHREGR